MRRTPPLRRLGRAKESVFRRGFWRPQWPRKPYLPPTAISLTPVTNSISLVAATRVAVTDSYQIVAATRATATDAFQIVAATRTTATDQIQLVAATRQAVTDASILRANTRTLATDSVQILANTRQAITDTFTIRHNTLAVVSGTPKTFSIVANTRALATDSLAILSATRALANDSVVLRANTRALITDAFQIIAATRISATDAFQIVANTRALATDSLALRANTAALITDTFVIRANTMISASDAIQLVAATRALATDAIVLRANTRALATDSLSLLAHTRAIIRGASLLTTNQAGIETSAAGWANGFNPGGLGFTMTQASDQVHGGSFALKTLFSSGTGASQFNINTNPLTSIPAKPGQPYIGGAWVRVNRSQSVSLNIDYFNSVPSYIISHTKTVTLPADTWVWMAANSLGAPSNAAWVAITVSLNPNSGDAIWIDDADLYADAARLDIRANTGALATDSIQLLANTRAAVQDSFVVRAHTFVGVSDAAVLRAHTRALATDAVTLRTHTRALASDAFVIVANTAINGGTLTVDDQIILRHNTAALVTDSLLLRANTSALVQDSIILRSNSRALITDALQILAHTRLRIFAANYAKNAVPPFSEWKLNGGATVDAAGVLTLPTVGANASIMIPWDGSTLPNFYISAESMAANFETEPTFSPFTGVHFGSGYLGADGITPVNNSQPNTGNGFAGKTTVSSLGVWAPRVQWAGPGLMAATGKFLLINMFCSTQYTGAGVKYRNPMVTSVSHGSGSPYVGMGFNILANTREAISDNIVLRANTRALVADAIQLLSNTRALMSDSFTIRANTRQSVIDSLTIRANTLRSASDAITLLAHVRALVTDTFTILAKSIGFIPAPVVDERTPFFADFDDLPSDVFGGNGSTVLLTGEATDVVVETGPGGVT